jgi:hypothetical protein
VFFIGVPPIARVPGIFFHASSAIITAYGIVKKRPFPYYMLAVTLHIANNFLAITADISLGIFAELFVLISVYLLAWRFYHQASKEKMVF